MSLGVLNNLSAMYAENNLNKTSSSLNTVLQQLSSGSRINSGADDAAGLALIDGLAANSAALTQSATNASEGVGLLTVADGALSQVTSLLNRAVTLATEVSNGTLNDSQQSAANKEYQSILSEIDNIGSTTTYNSMTVFGSTTDIYTGDSSAQGSSIDSLNIATLSSSSVGDTNGVMSYSGSSTSKGDVFIDLGSSTTINGSSTIATGATVAVSYLDSTGAVATKTITNTGTTVNSMVDAINNSGLGLTATLTLGQVAGGGTAGDEGIMITGSVGTGTVSSSSYKGSLTAGTTTDDSLSGSITIQTGSGTAQTIQMSDVSSAEGGTKFSDLAAYINSDTGLGVTASYAAGKISLTSNGSSTPALNVTSSLDDTTSGTNADYTATAAYSISIGTATITGTGITATTVAGTTTSANATATISYTDDAGQSLSGTDLLSQDDAQAALTALNSAITDVAAQDGYIGAQINTLNSMKDVLSTQQQNVVSAQDAIQATDYSSATSAMSKYEILSQTGIAALAQANSQAQEVTKLLQ